MDGKGTFELLALGLVLELVLLEKHSDLLEDLDCVFGLADFYAGEIRAV